MRPSRTSLTLLSALAACTGMWAQDLKDIPPPTPPLVAPVPEYADWKVTVQYPPEPSPPPGAAVHHDWRFVEVHSTKAGKLKRDLVTSREGIKNEKWFVESMLLWTTAKGEVAVNDMRSAEASDPEADNPSVASGFPGVGWLRLDRYDRVVMFEKLPCYHYVFGEMEAWIDAETRLPVAYKRGPIYYRFKFNAPPDRPLTMPPAYQKAWEALRKILDGRK